MTKKKPKIQIVNDEDEIIAHKVRSEVDHQKDIYRVAALWLVNSKRQVLIAQRKLTKDKDPGKWGPAVAGTVDEGETYEANIVKEAEEEIGLTGIEFKKGFKVRIRVPRNYFGQWFTALCDWPADKFRIQEEEVEKVEWVDYEYLLDDISKNPDKYIPGFDRTTGLFKESHEA